LKGSIGYLTSEGCSLQAQLRCLAHQFRLHCLGVVLLLISPSLVAQTSVATGSIVGTVNDTSGAVIIGAQIIITNGGTGQDIKVTTNSAGMYNSGALFPGSYTLRVSADGFATVTARVTVLIGNTTSENVKLPVRAEDEVIDVTSSELQINTQQAMVQGVLNSMQIETLPVNGRNFLDMAQLEPGVQIQDGQNFDPTKAGYSSISFGGRYGRTARIEVDGVDVSDETVGTTTTDIPSSAIQEFQLSQSSLDLSSELTSSGAVNVVTRSGTNEFHGEAFDLFRDSSIAANLPTPPGFRSPFQRSQFGGRFGGPIVTNKAFFFLDGERTKQDEFSPVPVGPPFQAFSGGFTSPFRESNLLGRADYQFTHGAHVFYRYSYYQGFLFATQGSGFQVYDTKNITRAHVIGADFNTDTFTHAIRFEYLKFGNQIVDETKGGNLPLANLGLELFMVGPGLATGTNFLAPQTTTQSNHQIKYDGTKAIRSHIIRYGVAFNHIQGFTFEALFRNQPADFTNVGPLEQSFAANSCGLGSPCFPGGISNPRNYPVEFVIVGNGSGFYSELPAFGQPAGGLGPDNRLGAYIGDSWKISSNFTLTYGLRYVRDTGRSDSDLPALPQLNALIQGLGNSVRQPNENLAPQVGFAWDPFSTGKTSIRGGIGLFFENSIWNNIFFDRPLRLVQGTFNAFPLACAGPGVNLPIPVAGGQIMPGTGVCGNASGGPVAIGTAVADITSFQNRYQALTSSNFNAPNPQFAGNLLSQGLSLSGGLIAPKYQTPRSIQLNIGIQRTLRRDMVLSADYLRNVNLHFLLALDVNHVGDLRFFNRNNALAAISATNNSFGCGTATDAAAINCAIENGATMVNYAVNGLTSASDFGGVCSFCAFRGMNPSAPTLQILFPIGRSVYNGLQIKLVQDFKRSAPAIRAVNFQLAYSLSRFENPGTLDQDIANSGALDNNNPNRYFGPSGLDRTHQISVGGFAEFPGSFRLSVISHFYSPLSTTLFVPVTGIGSGEIFRTDFTGDGTVQDPLPGTTFGNFDRGINASNINNVLTKYNNTTALNLTPAGQVLLHTGLFTAAQLGVGDSLCYQNPGNLPVNSLCAIAPPVPLAPKGQVDLSWLRAFDLRLAWRHVFKEGLTVEPSVGIYNVFNFANFDLPGNTLTGLLLGSAGSVNGTTYADHNVNRVGVGSGVFALGSPRQIEFGLRITF
jgi:Carboxypeptidase regulatory-like domain